MRQRRDAALRSLWWMLAASIIFPLLLFAYASWDNYRRSFRLADERNDQALAISYEHAMRVFQSIDVTFDSVEQITRGRSEQELREGEAELHVRLKQFAAALPDVASIWVLDRRADAIASSLFSPIPPAFNAPDREYLKAHVATEDNLRIGEVLRVPPNNHLLFPVNKRRFDRTNAFAGLTLASVSPQAFEKFYEQLAAKTGGSFALVRDDGAVLARYPLSTTIGIRLGATSGFGKLIASHPEGGEYTTISDVDQLQRRYAVRKLANYPLYVSSSLRTRDIVNGWVASMTSPLVFGVPALALVVVLIWLAMRRTSELYAESERRQALESALRHSQKMEALGQLTGGVAHDFNNLLMVIGGSLETLSRRIDLDERGRRLINAARLGVERGARLNQQLLAFARRQDLKVETVCIANLLPDIEALLERALGESIRLNLMQDPLPWHCSTDRNQLETAILNLAINSRDAMPDGGTLTLEIRNERVDAQFAKRWEASAGDYVVVRVSDTGSGMSAESAARAFEPFFTTKGVGKGTGLGLSQVYGFARQSGGFVTLDSREGHGTSVAILLPRVSAPATSDVPSKRRSEVGAAQGTVLIVEDDASVRDAAKMMTEELGYTALTAAGAIEALEILSRRDVDIVFSDVIMSGMSGFELAREIERRHPHLPVLITSGYTGPHRQPETATAQRPLLRKPYALSELSAALRQARESWPRRLLEPLG